MATVTTERKVRVVQPAVPPYPIYRFTVDQYHRMIQAGILTEKDRVELLEGWIVARMTHNPPHAGTIWLTQTALLSRLPSEWIVRVQSPLTTRDSAPEPDLVIARGPGQRYLTTHPRPGDVALVIEVSDTTLADDRNKVRVYARARIPVYWIINLEEAIVEVYTDPRTGRSPSYRQRSDYRIPDEIPLVIQAATVATLPVRELLP